MTAQPRSTSLRRRRLARPPKRHEGGAEALLCEEPLNALGWSPTAVQHRARLVCAHFRQCRGQSLQV